MAMQEISAFSDFTGTNKQGYVIVGGSNGVEGGKKILADIQQDTALRENVDFDNFESGDKILTNKNFSSSQFLFVDGNNELVGVDESSGGLHYDTRREGIFVNVDGNTIEEIFKTLCVKYDGDTIVENGNGLEVANPVPDTYNNANDGDVLTYNAQSDEIVWAAPQGGGGGSSLPAYTSDDDCAVLAVNSTHDGCEWIGFPSLGSAGEQGYSPVLRTRIDYIVPDGQPIEDGEWVNSTTFTNPGLPYRYITGEDSNASNDWANGKSWTISGNKAIAEIDNEMLCSMDDLDPVYGDSDFENVTEIEIRILIDSPLLPPFATIEFTNKTGNTVTITCSHGKKVNGTYKKWEQGIDYMYGSPLKLISLCGTTKSNSIPTNTFVQLQLLGTGYRLYTE